MKSKKSTAKAVRKPATKTVRKPKVPSATPKAASVDTKPAHSKRHMIVQVDGIDHITAAPVPETE